MTDFYRTFHQFQEAIKHPQPSEETKSQNYFYFLISEVGKMGPFLSEDFFSKYRILLLLDGFDESGWPENTKFYEETKLDQFCSKYGKLEVETKISFNHNAIYTHSMID